MAFGLFKNASEIPDTIDDKGHISPGVYKQPRGLTASASKIDLKDRKQAEKTKKRLATSTWQNEAWDYYDLIGEVKYSANHISNVLSRINLYPAYVEDTSRVPTPVRLAEATKEHHGLIEDILQLLESGDGGTSGLLRDSSLSLFVAGEFYLIKEPGNAFTKTPDKWQVRSISELIVEGSRGKDQVYYLKSTRNEPREDWIPLPSDGYMARMWRRHPRFSGEADSSLLGIIEDMDDLLVYSREGRQASRSRANAGLLFLPSELEASNQPDMDPEDDQPQEAQESLAEKIAEALIGTATTDDHANAVVPLIFSGPAQHGNDIKYIQLNRAADQMYQHLIDSKTDKILRSLDIPKEVASGLSDLKYNNSYMVDETLYKAHVEPMILLIVDLLTTGFLRPLLRKNGVPEDIVEKTVVWYDPSAIVAKPSKAEAANFGVEHDIVSGSAWRAANGYSESDAPTEEEQALKLLKEKLILDPAIATTMMQHMFPSILATSRETHLQDSTPGNANALDDALNTDQNLPEGVIQDGDLPPGTSSAPAVQPDTPLIEP